MNSEYSASRVTILDAVQLDSEIYNILKAQITNVIRFLPPGSLGSLETELDTLLRVIIWKLSVDKESATFGQQILKLKYRASLKRLRVLGFLLISSYYIKERKLALKRISSNPSFSLLVERAFDLTEVGLKILDLAALILFLRKGRCPTFMEMLLGLIPVSTVPPSARSVGYVYMTRELIWHGFSEFLGFLIPLINFNSLKRRFHYLVKRKQTKKVVSQKAILKLGVKCPLCSEVPVIPFEMGCPHVFCFYCLHAERAVDSNFECPKCDYSDSSPQAVKPVTIST